MKNALAVIFVNMI